MAEFEGKMFMVSLRRTYNRRYDIERDETQRRFLLIDYYVEKKSGSDTQTEILEASNGPCVESKDNDVQMLAGKFVK